MSSTEVKTAESRQASMKKRRLGRGLSSLIGQPVAIELAGPEASNQAGAASPHKTLIHNTVSESNGAREAGGAGGAATRADRPLEVRQVAVGQIRVSPFQPRKAFDPAGLERLAASIKTAGVMQPVVLRAVGGAGGGGGGGGGAARMFELVAGERRWRAAQMAGLETVPAVLAALTDEQAAEWALIENLQREDLGPMERAWALKGLVDRFGLAHADVAQRVGIDRSTVTNLVRLTELETVIQDLIAAGGISLGHGKALLGVPAGARRIELAGRAALGWSVRRLERAVRDLAKGALEAPSRAAEGSLASAGLADLEKQLGEHLGTRVRMHVRNGATRGRLSIEFYDLDHFDGLMGKLGFVMRS